jgi:hypothetical protein
MNFLQRKSPIKLLFTGPFRGGLYWTRTSDPIDVNDVLYQLSQQTAPKWGSPEKKTVCKNLQQIAASFPVRNL